MQKGKMTWGSTLENHTYKTLNASNFIACVLKCDEDPQCRSCNFWWNKLECELNFAATFSAATSFIREVDCVHRDMDLEPGMQSNLTMRDCYSSTISVMVTPITPMGLKHAVLLTNAFYVFLQLFHQGCPLESCTDDLFSTNTFTSVLCLSFTTNIVFKLLTKHHILTETAQENQGLTLELNCHERSEGGGRGV